MSAPTLKERIDNYIQDKEPRILCQCSKCHASAVGLIMFGLEMGFEAAREHTSDGEWHTSMSHKKYFSFADLKKEIEK